MIVLRKLCTNYANKIILPGTTERFFGLLVGDPSDAYDWNVKTIGSVGHNVTKITSLCFDDSVEFTKYASIGTRFDLSINILIDDGHCWLDITNNEQESIRCIIKVKIF